MPSQAAFWDGIAEKYARRPVQDVPAYETTLARTRAHLGPDARVLELGCGTGSTALALAPHLAHVTATDVARGMIAIARRKADEQGARNVVFRTADMLEAPQEQVDAVLGFNLLHLLPDTVAALAAMSAHLAPGGLLITKTPCLASKAWLFRPMIGLMRVFGRAPHVTFLAPDALERAVIDAGFDILETGDYPVSPPNHFIVARKR